MLKILGRNNSSNVQKVLWACSELGVPFEREDYGGQFGKTKEAEYLALNPNSVVPTIIDDGFVLWESNSIMRYLAAKHGDDTIYPADLQARALTERWMDWQMFISPTMVVVFWGLIRTKPEDRDNAAIAAGRDKLAGHMATLDRYVGENAYVASDNFTVGDIPVGIAAYRWFEMPIEREDYPNLKRWYDTLAQRPGFIKHIAIGLS
jgi:glutathione S-transferase